jgi:hypothetical protein
MAFEMTRAEWQPGMTGKDMILAVVGDQCPECGSYIDIDGPHKVGADAVGWFAHCPAPRCRWRCDQSLGVVPITPESGAS